MRDQAGYEPELRTLFQQTFAQNEIQMMLSPAFTVSLSAETSACLPSFNCLQALRAPRNLWFFKRCGTLLQIKVKPFF